jgi:Kef-type K+ transport system membrane component KefB
MVSLDICLILLSADNTGAATIPLAMLLVFGSAKLLGELFERMGQPGIVGEIFAGILIGPGVMNWIAPTDFLNALSELGVMFLLFRVGLEVKASELMRVGGTAVITATLGVAAPFLLGWAILSLWGTSQIEAIFVGAAMVATSIGITAQVLAAKGLLQERSSKIILAAAVIDDVLGLLILALVSSIAKGKVNIHELGMTALLAIGFTLIVVKWGTRTMGHVVPRVQKMLRAGESQFAFAMVLLFALSLISVYMGVAPIIGAFLAGMTLAETVGHRVHDLAHGVTELLVPFFLAGIGLHFNIQAFADGGTILLSLIVLVAAVLSKFIGCGAAALSLGKADAIRVGVGMIPRGEVGMVVAQIGLVLGVIGEQIYAVVVFMAVVTTMLTPMLLTLAYRGVTPSRTGGLELFRID